MLKNLLHQSCEIFNETVTGVDALNDDVLEFVSAGTFPCRLEGWKGHEVEVDRDTRISYFKLYLDERADPYINGLSLIEVDSVRYEVIGTPQTFHGRAAVNHVEVVLRLIEG